MTISIFHRKSSHVLSDDRLRPLVERYLSGDTTNEEEALLRQHFTSAEADVPADLRYLKALFAYESANGMGKNRKAKADGKVATRRTVAWMAVAASVAVLFLVTLPRHESSVNYVVIDGQRYVESEKVMEEAEATLDMVAYSNDAFSALDMMTADGESAQ